MRILFVGKRRYTNRDALRERFGRIYQLPLQWHRAGHDVMLALIDYRGAGHEASQRDGFPVESLPLRDPRAMLRLHALAREFRPTAIVASGDCFIALAALRCARSVGASFVFDVYDDYRTFGAYRAFIGWDAFGFLVRRADQVWYASHALAATHSGGAPCSVVPNGVDPAEFRPGPAGPARERVGLAQDQRWIGYFGSLEDERGPADLVAAVGHLHAEDASVRLVLCGGGAQRDLRAPWVEYRGNVAHHAIPDYLNASDVVVLPYRRGPTIDMVSSCKMAEYLFCERPVVATDTPSLVRNFPLQARELGAAVCMPGDPRDLARAIRHQLDQRIVVSPPREQTWEIIARNAASTIPVR